MTGIEVSTKSFPDFPPPGFTGIVNTPNLVARCRSASDILQAVNYCSAIDEPVAIRSGGHAIDGHSMPDGAFVIDTSLMNKVEIDPATGVTTVETGVLLRDMDFATQRHGFVVPSGTVSDTGIAGLTLGGGMGYLNRRFGMTVDNLLAVNVITMDGRQLTASATENSELFWGLRGAGHNLAIATTFTFQAQKAGPEVMSGFIVYPIDVAPTFFSQLDNIMSAAPRELTIFPLFLPYLPLPEEIAGRPVFILLVVYTGEARSYESAMEGIRPLATPLADFVHLDDWVRTNAMLNTLATGGRRQHHRGGYLGRLTAEIAHAAIDLIMQGPEQGPEQAGPASTIAIVFPCLGGANFDFDEDSTAFSRKGAFWMWETLGQWDEAEDDDKFMRWVDSVMTAMDPYSLRNGYVNFSSDRGAQWLRCIYGSPEKWKRLCALKAEFDPKNLLLYNKNITKAQLALAERSSGSS